MRFEIAGTVPEHEAVKETCRAVAKAAKVPCSGLYVFVQKYGHGRATGRCYSDAGTIHRKGKPITVNGYIKLWYESLDQIARTFAHELSHLRDRRKAGYSKVPWGKEKRAKAFAEKVITRLERKEAS